MKLFAITLALAVLSGSWDSALSDEPFLKREARCSSKLNQLEQNVEEYFIEIKRGIEEQMAVVEGSNLGREVKKYATESLEKIDRRIQKIETELPREVSRALKQIAEIPMGVALQLLEIYLKVRPRVQPVMEELCDMLEPVVSPYAEPAVDQVRTYADALRSRIEELNNQKDKLKLQLEELETKVGPYIKNVQNQLQKFQVALQPLADTVQERVIQNVESATNTLKPYMSPVLEKISEYTRDFKKWV